MKDPLRTGWAMISMADDDDDVPPQRLLEELYFFWEVWSLWWQNSTQSSFWTDLRMSRKIMSQMEIASF